MAKKAIQSAAVEESAQTKPVAEARQDAPKTKTQTKPQRSARVKIMVNVGLVKDKGAWKYEELNGAVGSIISDRSKDRFSIVDLINSITGDPDAMAFALGKRSIPNSRVNMENVCNIALAIARGDFLTRDVCERVLADGDVLQLRIEIANSFVEHVLSHENLTEYCPEAQGYWQRGMTTNNVSALEITRAIVNAAQVNLVPNSAIRKLITHVLKCSIKFVETAPNDLDGKAPAPTKVKSVVKMLESKLVSLETGDATSVADWAFRHAIIRAPRSWAKV